MNNENSQKPCPFCGSSEKKELFGGLYQCSKCELSYRNITYRVDDPAIRPECRPEVWQLSQEHLYDENFALIEKELGYKGRILDIGCAQGYFLKSAIGRGYTGDGIEISCDEAEFGRKNFGLNIYDKPVEVLNLESGQYDIIMLWRVLDLVGDPKKTLEEAFRLLKPGGIVLIRVNNFCFHYSAFRLSHIPLIKKLNIQPGVIHRYGINSKSLRYILEKTGFNKISIANSKTSKGNPYGEGGRLGTSFVVIIKFLLSAIWKLTYALSFGKIVIASSIYAYARKPDDRKRVMHLITRLDKGGSSENVTETCGFLDACGFSPSLVYGSGAAAENRQYPAFKITNLKRNISPLHDIGAFFGILGILHKIKPHLLHTHSSKAGVLGRIAALFHPYEMKTIHTPHGHVFYGYDFSPFKTKIYILIELFLAYFTDILIGLTEGEINESIKLGIGTKEKWTRVPSGVNISELKAIYNNKNEFRERYRKELQIPDNCLLAGTVARLEPVKGITCLVEAFKYLKPESQIKLVVIGEGSQRRKLENIIRGNSLENAVTLLGHRDKPQDIMCAFDIFVQPSHNEGMGKTILYAQSLMIPVIGTQVQGIPDLVKDGITGLLVPPKDPKKISDAILKLKNDQIFLKKLSQNAFDNFYKININGFEEFSIKNSEFLIANIYKNLL